MWSLYIGDTEVLSSWGGSGSTWLTNYLNRTPLSSGTASAAWSYVEIPSWAELLVVYWYVNVWSAYVRLNIPLIVSINQLKASSNSITYYMSWEKYPSVKYDSSRNKVYVDAYNDYFFF